MKKHFLNIVLRFRRVLIVLFHALLVVLTFYLAFLLRFDSNIPPEYRVTFWSRILSLLTIKLFVFDRFELYSGLWRYVNYTDIWNIVKANTVAVMLFILVEVLTFRLQGFPRTVFFIDWTLCIVFMTGVRLVTRLLREYFTRLRLFDLPAWDILIIGAGDAGIILLGEYQRNPRMGRIAAFVDDDRGKQGRIIQGIKVLGKRADIPRLVEEHGIDEIILAIPSASGEDVRDILAWCARTRAKIKVVPGLTKILSGEMEVKPREVRPEDLLGRETVHIDNEEVAHYLKGRVVLVTGAGGSIGSEICRQVAAFAPREIILFDHYENLVYFLSIECKTRFPGVKVRTVIGDIRDVGLLKRLFSQARPQVVFHAAAHKHVPLMEESPVAAVKNNVFGTRNLIYAAHHYGVERFVLISTDKAVNPVNVMGLSKRVAEMILQSRAYRTRTRFMAVRFGNVLGSAGSVVPLFKEQIERGGPITVTHPDVKRYFMSIREAVMLVLEAGAIGKGGELFILDMGEQIKVVDLAKNLVALSGLKLEKDIQITFTGLRPGEKLEEELLLDKEKDDTTRHNKIFMSRHGIQFDRTKLNRSLKILQRFTQLMDEKNILKLLKEIVDSCNAGRGKQ